MSSGAVCSCWRTTTHIPKGITLSFITEASNTWGRAIQTRDSVGSGVAYLVHFGTRSHQIKARAFVTHCDCTWVPSAHPTLTSGARSVGRLALPVSSFNSWALYTRTWIWQLSNYELRAISFCRTENNDEWILRSTEIYLLLTDRYDITLRTRHMPTVNKKYTLVREFVRKLTYSISFMFK